MDHMAPRALIHPDPIAFSTDERSQRRQWCDELLSRADLINRPLSHEILLFGVEGIKTAVHEVVSGTGAGRIRFGGGDRRG